jgi:prefoldin subunit 5
MEQNERKCARSAEEKIAVLKRLREMLLREREKLRSYLALLEQEERSIEQGAAERLLAQVEMEQSIIAELFTLKKVIAPLQSLYHAAYPDTEDTIPRLQATLESMGAQVVAHNARNRKLLREQMDVLRQEICSLRSWPRAGSPFAEVVPSLVDITT